MQNTKSKTLISPKKQIQLIENVKKKSKISNSII